MADKGMGNLYIFFSHRHIRWLNQKKQNSPNAEIVILQYMNGSFHLNTHWIFSLLNGKLAASNEANKLFLLYNLKVFFRVLELGRGGGVWFGLTFREFSAHLLLMCS